MPAIHWLQKVFVPRITTDLSVKTFVLAVKYLTVMFCTDGTTMPYLHQITLSHKR